MSRRMTFDEGYRQAEIGAWRHYGRKYAFWFVFGPYILRALGFVVVIAGLTVAWLQISHVLLGVVTLGLGMVPVLVYGVRALNGSGVRSRIMDRARAGAKASPRRPGLSLGFAMSGFAVIMFVAAGLALVGPWS